MAASTRGRRRKSSGVRYGLSKTGDQEHIRRVGLISFCGKDLIPPFRTKPQTTNMCRRCLSYQDKANTPPPPPREPKPRVRKPKLNWYLITLPNGLTYRTIKRDDAQAMKNLSRGELEERRYEDVNA